jgi:hypothetical protein
LLTTLFFYFFLKFIFLYQILYCLDLIWLFTFFISSTLSISHLVSINAISSNFIRLIRSLIIILLELSSAYNRLILSINSVRYKFHYLSLIVLCVCSLYIWEIWTCKKFSTETQFTTSWFAIFQILLYYWILNQSTFTILWRISYFS